MSQRTGCAQVTALKFTRWCDQKLVGPAIERVQRSQRRLQRVPAGAAQVFPAGAPSQFVASDGRLDEPIAVRKVERIIRVVALPGSFDVLGPGVGSDCIGAIPAQSGA